IETELKINEYVDNICVCGDSNHNYLIALIVPNRVKLQTLSKLSDSNESKLEFNELVNDSKVIDAVLSSIKITAIEAGLMKYEIPQKVKLCEEEWTPENGLITAAMKVRRKQIQEFYANDIKAMYSTDINANQNRMQNGSDNKQINIL
ncbi:long chain fatty acid CoA ligase-like protein, partial [Dinothrombium tinctorium]